MDYEKPKCPFCDAELINQNTVELEEIDAVTIESITTGWCPKCRRNFCWEVTYKALYFRGLVPY